MPDSVEMFNVHMTSNCMGINYRELFQRGKSCALPTLFPTSLQCPVYLDYVLNDSVVHVCYLCSLAHAELMGINYSENLTILLFFFMFTGLNYLEPNIALEKMKI